MILAQMMEAVTVEVVMVVVAMAAAAMVVGVIVAVARARAAMAVEVMAEAMDVVVNWEVMKAVVTRVVATGAVEWDSAVEGGRARGTAMEPSEGG